MHKRLPNSTLLSLLFIVIAVVAGNIDSAKSQTLSQAKQDYSYVILDSMEAEYHPANKVVIVKGSIKNISNITLRGYISLHILSVNGAVLYSTEMAVKDHQPIRTGETVSFDTVLNVAKVAGAKQISADFTWD